MAAQIENTLRSLLPPYQRDIALGDYEIVLIDNGSARELPGRLQTLASIFAIIISRLTNRDEARRSRSIGLCGPRARPGFV